MSEVFLLLHPAVQVLAIAILGPLLLVLALLTSILVVVLIDEVATKLANCHANHCRTKIAVANKQRERIVRGSECELFDRCPMRKGDGTCYCWQARSGE